MLDPIKNPIKCSESVIIPSLTIPSLTTPSWSPFKLCGLNERPIQPRSLQCKEGVADRLRVAAFAEIQAREAFRWAAKAFSESAPPGLCQAWLELALAEDKHLNWLLNRMIELAEPVDARAVSDHLWQSFARCKTAQEFAAYMANSEERGRIAGEKFYLGLKEIDPISAEIFGKIAEEEREHIALAQRFFGTPIGTRT